MAEPEKVVKLSDVQKLQRLKHSKLCFKVFQKAMGTVSKEMIHLDHNLAVWVPGKDLEDWRGHSANVGKVC